MQFFAILSALTAVCSAYTTLTQTQFDDLNCTAGVGWAYSMNGCTKQFLAHCGVYWEFVTSFNIDDGNNGVITVRLLRKFPVGQDYTELNLFFPGSNSFSNWQTNFNYPKVSVDFNGRCSGCEVHGGFWTAFSKGREAIKTNVKQYMQPKDRLVIIGGSLGGALAALAYATFQSDWSHGLIPNRGLSFGQPRVGNAQWAAYMNGLTKANEANPLWVRVTHEKDTIPQSPPSNYGFMHFGPETWMKDINSNLRPTPGSSFTCTLGYFGAEPSDCINGAGSSIFDHTTYPGYQGEAAKCPP